MQALHQVFRSIDGEIFEGDGSRELCAAHEREYLRQQRMKSLKKIGYHEIDIAESFQEEFPTRKHATLCIASPKTEDEYKEIVGLLSSYYAPRGLRDAQIIPKLPCDVHFIVYDGYKNPHIKFVPISVAAKFTEHLKTASEKEKEIAKTKTSHNPSGKAKLYTFNGKTQSINAWAKEVGMHQPVLSYRLNHGWDFARAIQPPVHSAR